MSTGNRDLGMSTDISRRDFINGVSAMAGSLAMANLSHAADLAPEGGPATRTSAYPPERMGMRGSHPGSFEAAHDLRDGHLPPLGSATRTGETYDLVVVGGGLSGLAAAHLFLKNAGSDARVLIIDNHDDFGGHAKRNEFHVDGRTVVLNGGTLEVESPKRYGQWAREVLADIGVDLDRYVRANQGISSLYESHGLGSGYFFDRQTFGRDRLVVSRGHEGAAPFAAANLRNMPISGQARRDLQRLFDPGQPDYLPGMTDAEKVALLARTSYRDFLLQYAKVDPQAYWFFSAMGCDVFCVGADALPALFAWQMTDGKGAGFSGLRLPPSADALLADLPGGQHGRQRPGEGNIHFPDGNATIARLLVRKLVPDAVPGRTQEDVGMARVDYAALDRPANRTRIRLNSVVLNVRHDGDPSAATDVIVDYQTAGQLYEVRGRACIMACWNMFIPYLVPELPASQKKALSDNVKGPIVYTNVFLRNWRAFERLGVSDILCPTMYHHSVGLAEPCDLGELRHARGPDDPVAIQMERTPAAPGLPRREQHRLGRADLLGTSFETFEWNIRDQLARMLGAGGFDPARDIVGIAVNRWPHGFSYTYNSLYDPMEWVFTESDARPCVLARRPFGRISIANADAAASPHTDAALLEAHRAVEEVLERRTYPFLLGEQRHGA